MRRPLPLLLASSAFLAVAVTALGTADDAAIWKPVLPEAELKPLIEKAAKAIQEELAAPEPATKAASKARALAVLIAAAAQSSMQRPGADAGRLAGLRDAALSLADAIRQKKYADAKKHATALAALRPEAAGKPGTVPLHQPAERDDLTLVTMQLFAVRTRGGLGLDSQPAKNVDGIEARLVALSRKPLTPEELGKQADEIARAAYVSALLGELTHALAPEKDAGKKKRSEWIAWSEEMRDASQKLAEAARAKNPKDVRAAAAKVNATCNNCHDVFRTE